ncbi:hypothetical protein [Aromatoleum sp.]|uniref:hypothetical protein n=1 Tax=Aromatoleum sp. TaxID=2307007 RepID=UPI002FC5E9C9
MPRAAKKLKQAFSASGDEAHRQAAAVALLRHSLDLGHRRLSLKRLEAAVSCGATLDDDDLARCAELVLRVADPGVQARLAHLSRQLSAHASFVCIAGRRARRRSRTLTAPEYRTKDHKLHVRRVDVLSTADEGRLDESVRWGESESKW